MLDSALGCLLGAEGQFNTLLEVAPCRVARHLPCDALGSPSGTCSRVWLAERLLYCLSEPLGVTEHAG